MTPTVAMTFDDGPSTWTPMLLTVLAAHDARATFFVLGSQIAGREEILRAAAAAGHELGVHGWDHTPADALSPAELLETVQRTGGLIEAVTGIPPTRWRPPWLRSSITDAAAVAGNGYHYCGVTLDGRDASREEEAIFDTVRRGLQEGAIVGLHDGVAANGEQVVTHRVGTVRAVERLLPLCRSVTVSELLA